MSNLHGEIMNLPCDKAKADRGYVDHRQAYRYGHRDARHAAAELVAAHEAGRAQPAEAEGVEVVAFIQTGNGMKPSARLGTPADLYFPCGAWLGYAFEPLMTVAQHQSILSAVTAERDRLLESRVLDAETISTLEQELKQSRDAYQHMIDQTMPLEPVPGDPRWSKRIELDDVIAERDQLRAEVEELRKDAERYRWIRDKSSMPGVVSSNSQAEKYFNEYMLCGEPMDKAIDAAMANQEGAR